MMYSIYTIEARLNESDENYHKYIMITNTEKGIMFINKGLFSTLFENESALNDSAIDIINKKHIGDVEL